MAESNRATRSQWQCLLENLGAWHGSFTRFSPQGKVLEDTPTIVSFTGLNDNQTMRQIVRRLPANQPVEEKVLEYTTLGRGILFFDNGAFSQGSIQLAPFAEFGAELGLISGDRRLRLVQLFDNSGKLDRLTLIREQLAGTNTPERPQLTVDDLGGEWQGEAVTIYPDWRSPDTYATKLKIEIIGDRLRQELSFLGRNLTSLASIQGSILYFDSGSQVLLLPDGASATSPCQVKGGKAFFLEVGWLVAPQQRQRMIRAYSDKGEWIGLTLVTEQRQ